MAELVLEALGVGRRLGGRWALRDVSVAVRRGESVMLHGPNGSGKTTLLRVLASALSPTTGTVRTFGGEPRENRRRIGLLSHADGHWDELSGLDNLELARSLGKFSGSVAEVLDRVGLTSRAGDPVRAYSAGMRKRLAFARLLLKNPELILLDEPYAALDADGHGFVDELLNSFSGAGRTLIVSTHQTSRVRRFCDRELVLAEGRLATGHVAPGASRDSGPPADSETGSGPA